LARVFTPFNIAPRASSRNFNSFAATLFSPSGSQLDSSEILYLKL
jgi:hypothetical protein